MSGSVGTWAWSQHTGGRLRRRDRARLLAQAVAARVGQLAPFARGGLLAGLSLEVPEPPDSRLALEAEERVRELSEPALHAHCMRTWAFAAMFARRDRVAHDPELLYLACVLHDLGLTEAHDRRDPSALCFAVEGARAAHGLMRSHGEPEERARRVGEAIAMHLNVSVPRRMGAEAHLLGRGVALDTIGRHARRLPDAGLRAVDGRWPREGFSTYLIDATARQAHVRPGSRSALLHALGFARLLAANPLDRGSRPDLTDARSPA